MATKYSTFRKVFEDELGHRDVGQQHKLFNETVGVQHGFRYDVDRIIRFAAHFKANFGAGQQKSPKSNQIGR